jgi:ATP-binding cassette subfamily B protein
MKIESRDYRLWDFFKIPLVVSPGMTLLRVIDKIIYALIPSLQVLTTAAFIDTAIRIVGGQAGKSAIVMPLVWIVLLISHQYITFALMGLVRSKMDINLTNAFRTAVADKRAALAYRHIENNDTWDLIQRVGKDPAKRISSGFDILLRMADMVIRVAAILLVLITQVWWAAFVILTFSIPLFWLSVKSGKDNYEASKEAAKHTRRAEYLQSVLTGREHVEERSLFAYSNVLNKRYHEKYSAAYQINMKTQRSRFIRMKSASLITVLISILIAGVLIAPLDAGTITIGMFIGFVTATFGLAQLMSWELTHITSELANNREYLRDLSAFSKFTETAGAKDLPTVAVTEPKCIEFRDVSFAYPDTDRQILNHFSLKLHAKKHYAFVGVNGAGKTTLTKLLTCLYDNYTGEICIDGKNLRNFTQSQLKGIFSIVYQDFAKYQISLSDSIGLGNANGVTESEIIDCARTLGLDNVAGSLPDGYRTPIGRIKSDGVDLSGGEWQKIAIARSLVSHAPVTILDEPTAALDPVAESEVYELFGKISKGKSTIFITHRLGAARLADEIFVIADGHVAEWGSHQELIAKAGIYAEMFESQRGWYIPCPPLADDVKEYM